MTKSKDKKGEAWTQSHVKPYKLDIEVKGQGRIRIMNVLDTSSHLTHPLMCQIWYANVKANRSYRLDMKTWQKPWPGGKRSTSNLDQKCTWHIILWWYTHEPNMVGQCQTKKKVLGQTQICTDRVTDNQTDGETEYFYIHVPPEPLSLGYKKSGWGTGDQRARVLQLQWTVIFKIGFTLIL